MPPDVPEAIPVMPEHKTNAGVRRDPYMVKAVMHASQLLSAFRSSGEALPLRFALRAEYLSLRGSSPRT